MSHFFSSYYYTRTWKPYVCIIVCTEKFVRMTDVFISLFVHLPLALVRAKSSRFPAGRERKLSSDPNPGNDNNYSCARCSIRALYLLGSVPCVRGMRSYSFVMLIAVGRSNRKTGCATCGFGPFPTYWNILFFFQSEEKALEDTTFYIWKVLCWIFYILWVKF